MEVRMGEGAVICAVREEASSETAARAVLALA
jgi:hypothetical protein